MFDILYSKFCALRVAADQHMMPHAVAATHATSGLKMPWPYLPLSATICSTVSQVLASTCR
jgi:hypothetical protein